MGDIVLTSPVVRCLKTQVPGVEIHYLVKESFAQILQGSPYIDQLHTLDPRNRKALIRTLRGQRFDRIIDLHHNLRTLGFKQELRVPARSFPKLNMEKWIRIYLRWNILPDLSVVDRYMKTVEDLGVVNDQQGLDYFIPPGGGFPEERLPLTHRRGFLAMAIGATRYTRRLLDTQLKEICHKISMPVVLLGGRAEKGTGAMLQESFPGKVFNTCGLLTLHQSADLVRQARLVLAHDTGLMHIAAAFHKPVIAVYGSSIPEFGMYPYYGNNHLRRDISGNWDLIQIPHLYCRPCAKFGYDFCPLGHFKCIRSLDMDQIIGKAERRWNQVQQQ